MADLKLLNEKIAESGMTKAFIARKCGMQRPTLCNRLKGKGRFCDTEIMGLTKTLKLTKGERDKIFFV